MMRSLSSLPVSLLFLSWSILALADSDTTRLDCAHKNGKDASCNEPIDAVTPITPGYYYIAKVPCLDCPIVVNEGDVPGQKHYITEAENELFFNITLSHDNTTLLLNRKPIFPSLTASLSVEPPRIYVPQIRPNFSRANLDDTLACFKDVKLFMPKYYECYVQPSLSSVTLDYDYSARQLERHDDEVTWEVTFDAIGGRDGYLGDPMWMFNRTEQKMLSVTLRGIEMEQDKILPDPQAASTLFGPFGEEQQTRYEWEILKVEIVHRSYTFPPRPKSTFWSKVKHFFGNDPAPPQNHVIYHQEEWSDYGKKGTLRNEIGNIIYGWWWDLIFIIVASVIGGLIALYGLYRLVLLILEQRRLAQWGGMDEVWRQIRQDGDEEDRLLDGGWRYRDDPDDTLSEPPRYTDELPVNKPLPSKPLPEKPLPDVPLVDDI